MRLIDADELIKGRVENDPVRIAAICAPTVCDNEAVEKRKPKKPIFDAALDKLAKRYQCPDCGKVMIRDRRDTDNRTFCDRCGLEIDWSEEE